MSDVFTLKQLAEHLQLSERTIYRLLGRGQLPGFKVGGHWRFRRSVVDYWMDMRMGRMSTAELREMDQEWRAPALPLSDALAIQNALVPLAGGSPRDIIGQFVRAVTFPESVNAEELITRIWEREQLDSTATDDGVAFLHTARWDGRAMRRHDLVAVGRLPAGVTFGAVAGGPTDVLLLLLARDVRHHLLLLAKAARLCRQSGFLPDVRRARSPGEVVALVRDAERRLFIESSAPLS